MRQTYDALLTSLAEEIGLDAPSLLSTEEILIDNLPISLQFEGNDEHGDVLLCSLLGTVPAQRWAEVARTLLWANHGGTGTRGGTLGVVPEDDMVTMTMRRPLQSLDADKLAALLGWMTDTCLAWRDYVSGESSAEPPELFQMQLGSYA
ncbi:CesT family type III secretion system chaperone [Comamonas endophytica]|uniref:CesT family type III secretion system chaperone n=1 Tax=Comamonas endophytica TaxID=2949090 RepID=A0ABY6GDT4_9BURK|nr:MULTISPECIES: CesT family type III secretion system chaperone [unclassified Acidovorax]MCD2513523.1 CesT family type III secretion system chaperone [Acidovorax sp. D4N7]UYG52465.1 CesT family type III secretion system chaperone [Acidovorax sp. 5MLIR]